MSMKIRDERPEDVHDIRCVTDAAFKLNDHASGTEAAIIGALREAGALVVSLVATEGDEVVGHIGFSPVTIDGRNLGWLGLGPVSVKPELHGCGIGSALVDAGLSRLRQAGAAGCVVLGDPGFYHRFGFKSAPMLTYEGAPTEYFMSLCFRGDAPRGKVAFHDGFSTQA